MTTNATLVAFRRSPWPPKFNRHEGCAHKRTQGRKPRTAK
jgi:hypothetical protein